MWRISGFHNLHTIHNNCRSTWFSYSDYRNNMTPVSYTHLDVYKRQPFSRWYWTYRKRKPIQKLPTQSPDHPIQSILSCESLTTLCNTCFRLKITQTRGGKTINYLTPVDSILQFCSNPICTVYNSYVWSNFTVPKDFTNTITSEQSSCSPSTVWSEESIIWNRWC